MSLLWSKTNGDALRGIPVLLLLQANASARRQRWKYLTGTTTGPFLPSKTALVRCEVWGGAVKGRSSFTQSSPASGPTRPFAAERRRWLQREAGL